MPLNKIDPTLAVLIGALCAGVVWIGLGMRGDAGVFPVIAGSLGGLACLGIGINSFRRKRPDESQPPIAWQRFTLWCLCVLGLLGLMISVGTFVALVVFLLVSLCCLSDLRWPAALILAVSFSSLIYAVFVHLLAVPLPSGGLWNWLAN